MKRIIISLLLATVLVFCFTGCAGDSAEGNLTDGTTQSDITNSTQSVLDVPSKTDSPTSENYIGKEKATEIALNHAGTTADKVYGLRVELDREYGLIYYEVDFKISGTNTEYDYDINATTGEIIKMEKDLID